MTLILLSVTAVLAAVAVQQAARSAARPVPVRVRSRR